MEMGKESLCHCSLSSNISVSDIVWWMKIESEILCGASMVQIENERLYVTSGLHAQNCGHF